MITDDWLIHSSPNEIGGEHRIYRFRDGHGLSLINSPMAHSYPYAWEAAVLLGVSDDGSSEGLDYSSPLTSDVEVFFTDEETNAFIARAAEYFGGPYHKTLLAAKKARES